MAADVYDAVEALGGERFDVVYTGLGALNWLPDLPRWADVVASLLADGGFLYLSEFHPFAWVFGDDDLTIEHDYFHDPEGVAFEDDGPAATPTSRRRPINNATHEWAHPVADVVTAVLGAGLRLELLPRARLHPVSPLRRISRRIASCRGGRRLPPARGHAAAAADVLAARSARLSAATCRRSTRR